MNSVDEGVVRRAGATARGFGQRNLLLAGVLAVVLVASVVVAMRLVHEEPGVPARVCNGQFAGLQVAELAADRDGAFEVLPPASGELTDFPGRSDGRATSCELRVGNTQVSIGVEVPGSWEDPTNLAREEHFAELGPVWGVYSPRGGTVRTNLSCPTEDDPDAKLKVIVGSSTTQGRGDGNRPSDEAVSRLARFSADATRSLATHFRCPAAADIPAGPMRVRGIRQ